MTEEMSTASTLVALVPIILIAVVVVGGVVFMAWSFDTSTSKTPEPSTPKYRKSPTVPKTDVRYSDRGRRAREEYMGMIRRGAGRPSDPGTKV